MVAERADSRPASGWIPSRAAPRTAIKGVARATFERALFMKGTYLGFWFVVNGPRPVAWLVYRDIAEVSWKTLTGEAMAEQDCTGHSVLVY